MQASHLFAKAAVSRQPWWENVSLMASRLIERSCSRDAVGRMGLVRSTIGSATVRAMIPAVTMSG